jgi:hypothetical protein
MSYYLVAYFVEIYSLPLMKDMNKFQASHWRRIDQPAPSKGIS